MPGPVRLIRFLAVGSGAYLVATGALYLLVDLQGFPAWAVWPPLWVVLQAAAYALHRVVTFPDRRPRFWPGLLRFYGVALGAGALAGAIVIGLHDLLGVSAAASGTIAAGAVPLFNFVAHSGWTFAHPGRESP